MTAENILPLVNIDEINRVVDQGRNAVIKAIKSALRKRTGISWSVTGGRGTAWGWITVDAMPARATSHCVKKDGATMNRPEDYEMRDTGVAGGNMTDADRELLKQVTGSDVHYQGWSIPASSAFYRVALCRAIYGSDCGQKAEVYWD